MTTLVVSDLDRTLIYSPSALMLPFADDQVPPLLTVEVIEGRPHSFLTLTAAQQLCAISRMVDFAPITTRTVAQYRRVRFPGVRHRFAITSNGGNILIHGEPDQEWNRRVCRDIDRCAATLAEVCAELSVRAHDRWALKRRVGDGLFCYLVIDPSRMPDDFLPGWRQWCADRGWQVSMQGRKIYAIPEPLNKERALAEVSARLGATRVLAAGDGALDAGFLAAADEGMRPPHGELAALDWQHPTVRVGSRSGVLAADDIVEWFAADVGLPPADREFSGGHL